MSPLVDAFEAAHVLHHGTFARYPRIALGKFGVAPSRRIQGTIERIDDQLASLPAALQVRSSMAWLGKVVART